MAGAVYTYTTVLDEVRLSLGWKGTDKVLTDAEIERSIYSHIPNLSQAWNFSVKLTGKLYTSDNKYPYGLMLLGTGGAGAVGGPTFTGEDDKVYVSNAKGSIRVTTGTHSTTSITVEGARVEYPALMVEILHFLATNRCQEISVSVGYEGISSAQIHSQLLEMADYWTGIIKVI